MPAALHVPVRAASQQVHAAQRADEGQAGDRADQLEVFQAEVADQRRHPVGHGVGAAVDAEVDKPGNVQLRVAQHAAEMAARGAGLAGQGIGDLPFLLVAQPAGLFRSVGQPEPAEQAEQHRRGAGEEEQHLPVAQAEPAVQMGHDRAGQRTADDPGDHPGHDEGGGDAPAQRGGEPVGEVENDAGEEAGLGHPQQEAGEDQLVGRGDEGGADGHQAPEHHDPREGGAGADALQVEVARYLEEDVAEVEDAGAEAVGGVGQGNVLGHAQLGEGQVQAVDGVDDVGEHQEGHQPPDDFGVQRSRRERGRRGGRGLLDGVGHGGFLRGGLVVVVLAGGAEARLMGRV
ncbi:hypothetical protein D3C78_1060980 [compost metagenome]